MTIGLYKFNIGDTIKAIRSGSLALIKDIDLKTQSYLYEYLEPSCLNYQGIHKHSFDEIEAHWDLVKSENNQSTSKCHHHWKKYLGLNEKFEYCLICDEKRKLTQ